MRTVPDCIQEHPARTWKRTVELGTTDCKLELHLGVSLALDQEPRGACTLRGDLRVDPQGSARGSTRQRGNMGSAHQHRIRNTS